VMEKNNRSVAQVFARYQESATGQMRYVLAQKNMALLHAFDRPLTILDAAGGNGANTQWLARQGHAVTLLDADPEMLKQAEQRLAKEALLERCRLVGGRIEKADDLLPHGHFDLVLCHHIIEYLADPRQAFSVIHKLAAAAGEFSLITLNPVSEVIRTVVFRKDAWLAYSKLVNSSFDAKWFGPATLYS